MTFLFTADYWLALATLVFLEIVLGIDNLVVLALTSAKLPLHLQKKARYIGLSLALIFRILLLGSIFWITRFTKPVFVLGSLGFSWRNIFFFFGGLFLIFKGILEILELFQNEAEGEHHSTSAKFVWAIIQIIFFDVLFSLDSIITAVGMTDQYSIMICAIIIAVIVMLLGSDVLCRFINQYARIKILALAFIVLIGVVLLLEGISVDVPRSYLYTVIIFSLVCETIQFLYSRLTQSK